MCPYPSSAADPSPAGTTYNVGAGYPTSNARVVTAIKQTLPDAHADLLPGRDPHGPARACFSTSAGCTKTPGYTPQYTTDHGAADYIAWLRAGNRR